MGNYTSNTQPTNRIRKRVPRYSQQQIDANIKALFGGGGGVSGGVSGGSIRPAKINAEPLSSATLHLNNYNPDGKINAPETSELDKSVKRFNYYDPDKLMQNLIQEYQLKGGHSEQNKANQSEYEKDYKNMVFSATSVTASNRHKNSTLADSSVMQLDGGSNRVKKDNDDDDDEDDDEDEDEDEDDDEDDYEDED